MVAYPHDRYPLSLWYVTGSGLLFCAGTLHLFTILTMKISKEQQSCLAIAMGLLVVAWVKHNSIFLIAAGIVIFCFPFRFLNRPLHKTWTGLSKFLGTISSHCILFVLFFFFLVPVAGLRRLFGKQEMAKGFPEKERSHFHERNHLFNAKDFLNPW
jgi:hypothetical protein